MALPTTALTLHCDASDTDRVFTTYAGSGVHTGAPANGDPIQVWDDEGDGIADVAVIYVVEPNFRSGGSALMQHSCIDFDGSTDWCETYTQTGGGEHTLASFFDADGWTFAAAIYPESITTTATGNSIYQNHILFGDEDANFGIYFRDASGTLKVGVFVASGGNYVTLEATITEDESHVIVVRYDNTNLYLSVDGGGESSQAAGQIDSLGGRGRLGLGHNSSTLYNGRVGEFVTYDAAVSGSDLADLVSYFTGKWLTATAYTLTADSGTFTLTGQAASLRAARLVSAAAGSFVVTGTAASLEVGYVLAAASGTFVVTGQDATLVYTPVGAYIIVADAGSFALMGQDATLTYAPVVGAGSGGSGPSRRSRGRQPAAPQQARPQRPRFSTPELPQPETWQPAAAGCDAGTLLLSADAAASFTEPRAATAEGRRRRKVQAPAPRPQVFEARDTATGGTLVLSAGVCRPAIYGDALPARLREAAVELVLYGRLG